MPPFTPTTPSRFFAWIILAIVSCSASPASGQENSSWWKSLFQGTQKSMCDSAATTPVVENAQEAPGVLIWQGDADAADASEVSRDAAPAEERPVGSITQTCDERILKFDSAWHAEEHVLRGFRIQVFAGSLQAARELRAQLRNTQHEWPVYLSSMPPNYRVTIGDFRTRWEAQKVQDEWVESFPMSIVIPMDINLPALH